MVCVFVLWGRGSIPQIVRSSENLQRADPGLP